LDGEAGFGYIQLQFLKLSLVESIHCRIDWEDCVKIVACPLHTGLIKIAAWLHSDESRFPKGADTFQCSVLGQTSFSGNGVVAGMTGVGFAILNQQQISIDYER